MFRWSTRSGRAGDEDIRYRLLRVCALLGVVCAIANPAAAQVNSRPGAVVLVARIYDQVGVQWGSQRVTRQLKSYGLLPDDVAPRDASAIVFQNTMHLAMGNVVSGETSLESPDGRAEMLALDPPGSEPGVTVSSFLAMAQPAPRWQSGDPRQGRHQVTQACLVVKEEGAAPTVRVRLTAL